MKWVVLRVANARFATASILREKDLMVVDATVVATLYGCRIDKPDTATGAKAGVAIDTYSNPPIDSGTSKSQRLCAVRDSLLKFKLCLLNFAIPGARHRASPQRNAGRSVESDTRPPIATHPLLVEVLEGAVRLTMKAHHNRHHLAQTQRTFASTLLHSVAEGRLWPLQSKTAAEVINRAKQRS